MTLKILKNHIFWHENVEFSPLFGNIIHYVTLLNLLTISGLLILLHGVISIQDVMSSDNVFLCFLIFFV